MAFKLGSINFNAVAQGVGGLVFGNADQNSQEDDGGVEKLLERIKNGISVEDRQNAMVELQDIVAESRSAQLAFGATGLPIILAVLREERNDLDLVRGSLEVLVNALASEGNFHGSKSQVQPGALNSELLAREEGSAALLLSFLEEQDFYIRYHTLRLLTMLTTSTSVSLQDAILATPQGITRLMDMMQDREVIRNEALLLLAHLTRSAEEIQKIAVFEGVFEKLFNIIIEEGGAEGGIVVQDCLELLNNIIRSNPSNQSFLRETLGLQPIVSILKFRKTNAHNFSKQKVLNVLCLLETVSLLLSQAPEKELGKDANVVANQTILAQNNLLDYLLVLSVEGRVSAVAVRCEALRCIGDLVHGHSRNCEILSRKVLGDEPDGEPALHSILNVLLHTSELAECIAAEYVIKCFCEQNHEGQIALASTITPSPESDTAGRTLEAESHVSFGSMLLKALKSSDDQRDLEASRRAVRVLIHILRNNLDCKEKILQIPLEISGLQLNAPEYLMSRCVRCLASAGKHLKTASPESVAETKIWLQPIFLKLLIVWLADCPAAVSSFLQTAAHLPYTVELLNTDSIASVHVSGLAAVLLGECVIYNTSVDSACSAQLLVDTISREVGLSTYFARWEALQNNHVFLMTSTGGGPKSASDEAVVEEESGVSVENGEDELENRDIGPAAGLYDAYLVKLVQRLEPIVRDTIVQLFSQPKAKTSLQPSLLDQKSGESESDYINRLKALMHKQTIEIQEITLRNAALAKELVKGGEVGLDAKYGGKLGLLSSPEDSITTKVEIESLHKQIADLHNQNEDLQRRQSEKELECSYYKQLANKFESDLKSLSAAYNSLELENNQLDKELKNIRGNGSRGVLAVDLEAAKEEGRNEALKESEAELNDLLVCLGQEEGKVKKLRARLEELGEDVDSLLQGIGEAEEDNDESDDDEE